MTQKVSCPVCKSQLQKITKEHLKTKKHLSALQKAGIKASNDPALNLIKTPQKKERKNRDIEQIVDKLLNLENVVNQLQIQQEQIFNYLNIKSDKVIKKKVKKIKQEEILDAVDKCVQIYKGKSRWVKIDDVISLLKIHREEELNSLNNILIMMFNQNVIDLAEGGEPKYPILYQNRIYGMVAHQ